MPSSNGSDTPSSSSQESAADPDVYTHAEKAECEEYYLEMLSHVAHRFRKYQPDLPVDSDRLREILDYIIRPGPETGLILNRGDLVSIPVMEVVDGSKVSMCGLRNQSEIVAREAVETFYREHLGDYATLDTAQSWHEYALNLATLLDAKSRWDEAKSGISFVAAPQPPPEIKTEADVAALDKVIEQLELQAEGISFVDVRSRARPKIVDTCEATDTGTTFGQSRKGHWAQQPASTAQSINGCWT